MNALAVTFPFEITTVMLGPNSGTLLSAPGEGNEIVLAAAAPEVTVS